MENHSPVTKLDKLRTSCLAILGQVSLLSLTLENNYGLPSYCLSLLFHSNNSERILFSSRDQIECKIFCKIADADSFVRGEILDIFIDILDESELDHLFEEEMDNIKHEVISYIYVLIYFIKLL